jgi:hypothetical protein
MPIFIKYEGVKGNVTENNGNGGVWKTTNFLTGGSARSSVGSVYGGFLGGVYVATSDLYSTGAIEVSRITFPNAPVGLGFIDSRDANAVSKARTIIGARRSSGTCLLTFDSQVTGAAHNFRKINNLKQLAASGRRIPAMTFLISDNSNSQFMAYKLKDVLVSSYQTSGTSSGEISLNFSKIEFKNIPTRD